MANHLTLKHTLYEFDEDGNLTIFREGKYLRIPALEVWQMVRWITREHQERLRALVEQATHSPTDCLASA